MKILMVCLGNICRSPLAQGILESKIKADGLNWFVDSAGTSGWHDGERPDHRAIKEANKNGIIIQHQRSRKITSEDLQYFDYILAMDSSNYNDILKLSSNTTNYKKVHLVLNFLHPGKNMAVPDPYYDDRFDLVYNLLNDALDQFIIFVKSGSQNQEAASARTL
ncbi:MAG: low molecular weight phosphotyrosine protein phosphatase [Saprospiraceae bacterium]|nr:low molecular weight phosphotyrosine protein phosphatase [Saprospiraceae bacterium]